MNRPIIKSGGDPSRCLLSPRTRFHGSLMHTLSCKLSFVCDPALVLKKNLGNFSRIEDSHYVRSIRAVSGTQIRHLATRIKLGVEPLRAFSGSTPNFWGSPVRTGSYRSSATVISALLEPSDRHGWRECRCCRSIHLPDGRYLYSSLAGIESSASPSSPLMSSPFTCGVGRKPPT